MGGLLFRLNCAIITLSGKIFCSVGSHAYLYAGRREHEGAMREVHGGIAYGIRKAARALVLLFAFVLLFSLSRQNAQAANILYGNGTISVSDISGDTEDETEGAAPTEAPEPTPVPKPKKQMAAEQYALGVILAGGIAIGMMVAVFFYYTRQNNQRD